MRRPNGARTSALRNRTWVASTVGLVAAAALLSGCHSSTGAGASDYCHDVKLAKHTLSSALSGSLPSQTGFTTALGDVRALAARAPGSVKPQWQFLLSSLTAVNSTLKKYGLTVADIPKLEQGKEPVVDPNEYQDLSQALRNLQSPALTKATAAINAETVKDCQVSLGSS